VTAPLGTGPRVRTAGTPLNQSIDRAAAVLGFFSPERPELTLSELTSRLGTSKATAHRYALALRRAGLLRYEPGRQVYALGPRIVELAASALAGLRIVKVAGPHMERLVARLNETVVLSIWDGESPVVVRVEDNTDRIARIVVATGTRLPFDSAQGKVFAAFGAQGASRSVDGDELDRIRVSRVAVNSRVVQGIRAVATPVFQETELVAAMAVVGTTASVPEDSSSAVAGALREAAEVLSTELGFLHDERSG
jgi:DNA-binding IclR family transcriptional regulator